ncbi:MAG: hypothetical protein HC902_05440 [Calothrix sp. SM1_5_4]|nr:hypothetical protein [Calothrix sp. SM1_5_4]
MVDEPVLAAIGSELPISEPTGSMVVDIGGGTAEIAIMSLGGIVYSNTVRAGGHEMDRRIVDFIRSTYNFLIGEPTAEQLKIRHGRVFGASTERNISVKGTSLTSGMPGVIMISEDDIARALEPSIRLIVDSTKEAITEAPPELSADLTELGIVLSGGVASLKGLDERMKQDLGIFVQVSPEPLLSVARGGGILLDRPDLLEMVAH